MNQYQGLATATRHVKEALVSDKWCWLAPDDAKSATEIVRQLGQIMPAPSGREYHDLVPYTKELAPAMSMSAKIGLDAQPRHTDAAFLPTPPRYIALQCLSVGEAACSTILWPAAVERLLKDKPAALFNSQWVCTATGHSPMYCYIVESSAHGLRLRFDPLCMQLLPRSRWTPIDIERDLDRYTACIEFNWVEGAVLIIDNWACLHGRGVGAAAAPSRVLRRWAIGTV